MHHNPSSQETLEFARVSNARTDWDELLPMDSGGHQDQRKFEKLLMLLLCLASATVNVALFLILVVLL